MNAYPLFKTKLSNERLMSALSLVLLLYNLPRFLAAPGDILTMLLLLVIGLVLDAVTHFILYKRPVCAVSAAVTALILFTLSPAAPFRAECAALAAALIAGKAVWGGAGKNPLNPAMVGLTLLFIFVPFKFPAFEPSLYLLPAVLLSLPFLFIRPYAGLGMMAGMLISLLYGRILSGAAVLTTGVFFWGCLVITDPVTTTSKPIAGLVIGLLTGFLPGLTGHPAAMPIGILISNLLSYLADRFDIGGAVKLRKKFGGGQKITISSESPYIDLTGEGCAAPYLSLPSRAEILRRIEKSGVFGMGGAAFPTAAKIKTVIESESRHKHLIVNAVECDPGLVHDKWLLTKRSDEIIRGIEILTACIPFKTVTIASKNPVGFHLPAAIKLHRVKDFYPAGAEKLLVRDIAGDALDVCIPAEAGILVLNVQTVCAISEAVLSGRAAETRYLTVADLDRRAGKVVRVRLGEGVYETARKVLPGAVNVFAGGGIMNARLADDGAVIGEKTNFLAAGRVAAFREALCSQCNFCSAYCPASLRVRDIAHYVDENRTDKVVLLHPGACMECGLCSAVCLAGRDQAKRIKTAKRHSAVLFP